MTDDTTPASDSTLHAAAGEVAPKLLEILDCPVPRETLSYDKSKQELVSKAARLAYPIRDGIPILLPEEARDLTDIEAGSA
ncbi:MAG: Trm112 family protein [Candidatus Phaeomarinobacter sp.]